MNVKLVLQVAQNRGRGSSYLSRLIEWPDGLPFPPKGESVFFDAKGDGEESVEVQWIEYRPLDLRYTAVIHCRGEVAEEPETSAEYAARRHPDWKTI